MYHHAVSLLNAAVAAVAAALVAAPMAASAAPIGTGVVPAVGGGSAVDSPAWHVDANHPASPFSGVVSIAIASPEGLGICTGALIGKRSVMSAAHCVDPSGRAMVVDLNDPQVNVTVLFNSEGTFNAAIPAKSVSMHANFQGFNVCPDGVTPGCLNDDIAVINLAEDAPASARIYKLAVDADRRQQVLLAGYGWSGNGIDGYTIPPDFGVKRIGLNYMDAFNPDDETGIGSEVWWADYDGAGVDTHCSYFNICTLVFPDVIESVIGRGDSGGPAFIFRYGEWMIAGTSTFIGGDGRFGTQFGGMVVGAYRDYLANASDSYVAFVPEPSGLLLFLLGGGLAGALRTRGTRTVRRQPAQG